MVKRYHLVMPDELYAELEAEANKRQSTVVELLRRFIKLGLVAIKVDETPDAALIIREGDKETRIVLY
jgi:hypothetical protein